MKGILCIVDRHFSKIFNKDHGLDLVRLKNCPNLINISGFFIKLHSLFLIVVWVMEYHIQIENKPWQ